MSEQGLQDNRIKIVEQFLPKKPPYWAHNSIISHRDECLQLTPKAVRGDLLCVNLFLKRLASLAGTLRCPEGAGSGA